MSSRYTLTVCIAVFLVAGIIGCKQEPVSKKRDFPDKEREIFILNNLAETVSVYQPDNGRLYNDVFTTGRVPNDILFYNDRLYIVCSADNTIEVYSESTFSSIDEIYLGAGNNPYSIIEGTAADPHIAYVPNYISNTVSVIDLNTLQVIETIEEESGSLNRPQDGAVMGGYLFICNSANNGTSIGEGSIAVFDIDDSWSFLTSFSTGEGSNPQTALALPGKEELHVYLTGDQSADDGEVLILDVSGLLASGSDPVKVEPPLAVGGSPCLSGSSYDAASGTVFLTGTYGLYRYDAANNALPVSPNENPIMALNDQSTDLFAGAAYDDENHILVLANFGEDKILVLDTQNDFGILNTLQASDGPLNPYLITE